MDKEKTNKEIIDSYDYLANASSATDYTGLMPTLADSEDKREAYDSIYHLYPPTSIKKND